jgi:hypothetical protein
MEKVNDVGSEQFLEKRRMERNPIRRGIESREETNLNKNSVQNKR